MLNDGLTGHLRARVCAGLAGDIVEIGFGAGLNQPYLPPEVTGVWAVEPSAAAVGSSRVRRDASPIPVVAAGGDAQALPFPDGSFDAALCTWVLCGIAAPGTALAEIARVLRPGGSLHFVEHGLAPHADVVRRQRRATRMGSAVAGCVLDNDVPGFLAASPLTVTRMASWYEPRAPRASGYMYEGRARA